MVCHRNDAACYPGQRPASIRNCRIQPYDPNKVGEQFRVAFAKEKPAPKVSKTDLIVIACIVAAVLITLLIRSMISGPIAAFPPLSGPFAWLTNGYFIVIAAGVTALCIYVLVRSFGWVRSIKKEEK